MPHTTVIDGVERVFGRIHDPDPRDKQYPATALIGAKPNIRKKAWWVDGWWGDQGSTDTCVAHAWTHWLEDAPVIPVMEGKQRSIPIVNPYDLYRETQLRDQWPGEDYGGTSVRACAKVLKHLGLIDEFRWAFTVDDVIDCVLYLGPMVLGTMWYSGMNRVDSNGLIYPRGRSEGGHAYVICGVDLDQDTFTIKNSWGKRWGNSGMAKIRISDFERLFKEFAEAAIAKQKRLVESVDWNSLPPPYVLT